MPCSIDFEEPLLTKGYSLNRRLFSLNGLSILAVVINHAAGWGQTALFWWAHRYRAVESPNFEQLGSSTYWALVMMKQLTVFSVPAFLFVSGAFMAYAGGSRGTALNLKTISMRVKWLLIPYFLWSGFYFLWEAVDKGVLPFKEYLIRLLTGQAFGPFFYVPILVQMLLISTWMVRWSSRRPAAVLIISGLVQISMLAFRYFQFEPLIRVFGIASPPTWFFGTWLFFFTSGIVITQHKTQIEGRLARYRWVFLSLLLLMASLAVLEPEGRLRATSDYSWTGTALTLSTSLYSILFLLSFLAFGNIDLPFSHFFYQLGAKSYGIYLSHGIVLELAARLGYHFAPFILAHQILLQPILILFGLGGPYLLISWLLKTRFRSLSRYFFG